MIDATRLLEKTIAIQGEHGNWDYDPYMHGVYNGMVFALSLLKSEEPQFRDAPDKWIRDEVGAL